MRTRRSKTKAKKQRTEEDYYLRREEVNARLARLPQGTVKKRLIHGHTYYYMQRREGRKVIHAYIGKELPPQLKKDLCEREKLRKELNKIQGIMIGFLADAIAGSKT